MSVFFDSFLNNNVQSLTHSVEISGWRERMVESFAWMFNPKLHLIKQPQDVTFGREEQRDCI